jgi:3-hydroxyisobutyrate dehydrogenase-like beta-hydroxyacid dehydrogenase
MGAAIGSVLVARGIEVGWASAGRSDATRARAQAFTDLGTLDRLGDACEVVVSVCPPHAAVEVASAFAGYSGLYVDANAVSPATAARVRDTVGGRFVDGGVIGPPPHRAEATRLYLSGQDAPVVAALFAGTDLSVRIVPDASALKMTYAAWTKGTTALLVAIRATARELGVEDELLTEWTLSLPGLPTRSQQAARTGAERGWRWAYELDEVGRTFAAAGQPDGFGAAAAEVFRRMAG